jgi:hypothetical protein
VLHLDLKSLNLLVDDNMRLKVGGCSTAALKTTLALTLFLFLQVGDFGLATLKRTRHSSVDAMGTVFVWIRLHYFCFVVLIKMIVVMIVAIILHVS